MAAAREAHRQVPRTWATRSSQLKLSLVMNGSDHKAAAFLPVSSRLMVACGLLPVCGCLRASVASEWIMQFQPGSLQFSVERALTAGAQLVSFSSESRYSSLPYL